VPPFRFQQALPITFESILAPRRFGGASTSP
jgi:hypothetical protein